MAPPTTGGVNRPAVFTPPASAAAKRPGGAPAPVKKNLKPKSAKERGKQKKKEKDPNKPKGAKSAYLYFSLSERPKIKAAEPELSFGDTAKRVGDRWKGLSAAAKAPYVAKAEADARRHEREMASYQQGQKA